MKKHNYFVIFLNKINTFINNLLKKYLNKLNFSYLIKQRSNIIHTNRVFLALVLLIILFFVYLSIPHVYNKSEIKIKLKNQLLAKFGTDFSFSKNINYKFFPRPHFVFEDSSIIHNNVEISDIEQLKIYVSLDNLFSLKNIKINDVILDNANFRFNIKNYNFFIKLLDNDFSESNFKVKNSNIFYFNSKKEVLFINKIIKMKYYYDPNDLKNIAYSKNEIFNIPYTYKISDNKVDKKLLSKINFSFLKLQIVNEIDYNDNIKKGSANFIFNKNKSKATYEFNNNYFNFNYFDKLKKPSFFYEGEINFTPFYSNFKGKTDKINLTSLLQPNDLLALFLKSKLLNNKNLNIHTNINSNKIKFYQNFINIHFNSKIEEGLIDIDNTKFSWNDYADFEISDSLIYNNNNQLILDGKLILYVKKPLEIYKFLLTPKKYRTEIKEVELNFNYNFDLKIMNLNNIKINNQNNQNVNKILKNLMFKSDKLQNKIYFKSKINAALKSYSG